MGRVVSCAAHVYDLIHIIQDTHIHARYTRQACALLARPLISMTVNSVNSEETNVYMYLCFLNSCIYIPNCLDLPIQLNTLNVHIRYTPPGLCIAGPTLPSMTADCVDSKDQATAFGRLSLMGGMGAVGFGIISSWIGGNSMAIDMYEFRILEVSLTGAWELGGLG